MGGPLFWNANFLMVLVLGPAACVAWEGGHTGDWANLARYRAENAQLGPPAAGENRVVFLGDSITDGWGHGDKFFPGKHYVNRGISGQTTPQMLERFQADVLDLKPRAVVILAGTNDIAGNTGPMTLEDTEKNLATMAERAKANGVRVVLCSVLPAYEFPWKKGLQPAGKVVALNAWIKDYAAKNGFVYVDYHTPMADERQGLPKELSGDGIHPNAKGYAIMAPLVEKSIAETLGQQATAQLSRRPPMPANALKSTEVTPDHRVIFRIMAPKATEVAVSGDFGQGGKLTKEEDGIWSITLGPLTPDYYSYTFTVDGVRVADPRNPLVKPGLSGTTESMFLVPGAEATFETLQEVPHGEVRAVWYKSGTLDTMRRVHVYTPPGYEGNAGKYPVLYLLHGAGDEDSGWSTIGRAGFILDNLIAAQKAVPMLIVMPNGSLPPPNSTRSPQSLDIRAAMEAAQARFTDELLKEIVPLVEKTYRVKTGQENRALAGLSMGGGQTWRTITAHPDQFGYVGMWSAAVFGRSPGDLETRYADFLGKADSFNANVKLFSISVGDKDFLVEGSKSLDEALTKHGTHHELHISGGGHTWINWRHYLNDFAPRLFR